MDSEELARRRLARLREELVDEETPLPLDGALGETLLEEILYGRYPNTHEGWVPCYGSLVFRAGASDWLQRQRQASVIRVDDHHPYLLRQFADGASAFLVRDTERILGLIFFNHSMEYEANLVELNRSSDALIVQRTSHNLVRIYAEESVTAWNGIEWTSKPHARRLQAPISRLVPQAAPEILQGLLDLCVYWISPRNQGATIVWYLHDADLDLQRDLSLSKSVAIPPLSVTNRDYFGGLMNALNQIDGAAVVLKSGELARLGVMLQSSDQTDRLVPAIGGARHTSARRFSFDEARALVFVVSTEGPVSVFSDGARIALVESRPTTPKLREGIDSVASLDEDGERIHPCPSCGKSLLIRAINFDGWEGPTKELACPACNKLVQVYAYDALIVGVRKQL